MLAMYSFVIFQWDPDQYCIEPYIFVIFQGMGVRLPMRGYRNFCQGVGSRPDCQKTALKFSFLFFFKSSTSIFYSFTEGVQWLIQRRLYFSKVSEGVQHFPGGGGSNEVQMLISIETHITCHFLGGSPDPYPPLLTRSCCLSPSGSAHELPRENSHLMKDLGNTLSN